MVLAFVVLALLWITAGSAWGQDSGSAATTTPASTAVLRGTVKAGSTPIPGATVALTQGEKHTSVVTDEAGRFQVGLLDDGPATVEVQVFGFQPRKLDVGSGELTQPLDVALELLAYRAPGQSPQQGRPQMARAGSFQNLQLMQNLESQISSTGSGEMAAAQSTASGVQDTSQSFLIQGTVSSGLQSTGPGFMPGMGMGGPEMDGGMGGPGGMAGAGMNAGMGGGAGGPMGGGMGGFGGGGFGGGGMGGGGFGGPGGGFGGPGGGRSLTAAQRQRLARQRGIDNGQLFGNRANRSNRNTIRGSLFFNLGNSEFDAKPYAVNGQEVQKPSYAQARFGATVGGMLKIPKLIESEKTFFFINYSGTRSKTSSSQYGIVPTAAERAGDFSATSAVLYDPQTGLPFANNQIPTSRLNSAALGLLNYYPLPNQVGARQNYAFITSVPQDSDTLATRLIHTLTSKDRLNGGVNLQRRSGETAQLLGFLDSSDGTGQSYSLGWTHNFNARIILNTTASYSLNRNESTPFFAYGADVSGALGISGNSREPVNYGPPNLNFTNFGSLSDGSPLLRRVHQYQYGTGLTMVEGKHTLQFGFQFRRRQFNTLTESNARGTFTFTGAATSAISSTGEAVQGTGLDLADFLLGLPQQSTIRSGGADQYLRSSGYTAFAQDEWRVRSNLTINVGLRYEIFQPFTEKYNRIVNLDVNSAYTSVAAVTPGATGPYSGVYPSGLINTDYNNFAPRLGIAYKPDRKTVLRVGYSIFYDGTVFDRSSTQLVAQPPFATTATYTTSSDTPLTLQNGFVGSPSVNVTNTYAVAKNYRIPYAQTWTASVQRDLGHGFVGEAIYIGTKGTGLAALLFPNRLITSGTPTTPAVYSIPNAGQFTYEVPEASSIFHAGQFRIMRRMRSGVSFNAMYQWSKSIDNASSIGGTGSTPAQNYQDLAAERGLSSFDRTHLLNVNAMWSSPFGQGRHQFSSPVLNGILRDWTITTALNVQSGPVFTARVLGNQSISTGGAVGSSRADATGVDLYSGSGFFNTAAFSVPASGSYGTAGRNTIRGPATFSMNAGLERSFPLGDNNRRRIEVGAQATNLTNHANVSSLGTVVNGADYGLVTAVGGMRQLSVNVRLRF